MDLHNIVSHGRGILVRGFVQVAAPHNKVHKIRCRTAKSAGIFKTSRPLRAEPAPHFRVNCHYPSTD